jgi:glutaredoxin
MEETETIVLYGTTWCGGSRRCRLLLESHDIPYQWVDIDQDEQGQKVVEKLNRGFRSVPTLVWPDGSSLSEPTEQELAKKLGLSL